jgi:hypothetical protein
MKLLLTTLLITLIAVTDSVTSAFKAGDASKLSVHFSNSIDLTVDEVEGVYSKAQAEQIVKKFFDTKRVSGYIQKHDGKKDATTFVVGELVTKAGKYRTYYLLKKEGSSDKIHQLRIEFDE